MTVAVMTDKSSAMLSSPICFVVGRGDAETTFSIPRDILSRSGMFPKEMQFSPPSHSDSISIELPDESPTAFTYFYSYIFFNDVRFPTIPEFDSEAPDTLRQREQMIHELCQTWVLGDKYSIPGLQNCAVYRICEMIGISYTKGGNCMTLDTLKYCYENTEPGAKLRTLVADHIIRIENRGHQRDDDLLAALSVFSGFTRDVLESQQSWNTSEIHMKYLAPYRYASRYQVDVDNHERIPAESRAVWRPTLLTYRCHYCGIGGDEIRILRSGRLRLCDSCVEDSQDLYYW